MIKLSILICTVPTPERIATLRELMSILDPQLKQFRGLIEHSIHDAGRSMTTGAKRNALLKLASGEYIVFIDDDDMVSEHYCSWMLRGLESGADCMAISGIMTTNGANETPWRISKDYENVSVKEGSRTVLLRKTNHITAVRREIALQAGFPDKSHAEDKYYSDRVSKLCKTELKIDGPIYHYRYSTKNKLYV